MLRLRVTKCDGTQMRKALVFRGLSANRPRGNLLDACALGAAVQRLSKAVHEQCAPRHADIVAIGQHDEHSARIRVATSAEFFCSRMN